MNWENAKWQMPNDHENPHGRQILCYFEWEIIISEEGKLDVPQVCNEWI